MFACIGFNAGSPACSPRLLVAGSELSIASRLRRARAFDMAVRLWQSRSSLMEPVNVIRMRILR